MSYLTSVKREEVAGVTVEQKSELLAMLAEVKDGLLTFEIRCERYGVEYGHRAWALISESLDGVEEVIRADE